MDISRVADIGTVNQTTLTKTSAHRTETKTSTLATEHTDSFVRSEATFTPAYTKKSAQKQNSDNNLTQKENSGEKELEKVDEQTAGSEREALMTKGISHIIRAMFVKQGEVLSGNVPSVGAKMYSEELLAQLRQLYGSSAAEENTAEYWQPDETAARMLMFFDSVNIDGSNRMLVLERSFNGAFNDTEQLFGGRGRLPLECYETRQMVMETYFVGSGV